MRGVCSSGTSSSAEWQLPLHATGYICASTGSELGISCKSGISFQFRIHSIQLWAELLSTCTAAADTASTATADVCFRFPPAAVCQVPAEPSTISAAAADHATTAADATNASLPWAGTGTASTGPTSLGTHALRVWVWVIQGIPNICPGTGACRHELIREAVRTE